MSTTQSRWLSFSGRALATMALMTTSGFLLHAQTARPTGTASLQGVSAQEPIFNLQTIQAGAADELYSSSSSSQQSAADDHTAQVASNTPPAFHFFNAMQYGGGRRRYGRPKYRGGNTNADGSPKYDFFVGGGFGMPTGDQFNYATTSWGFGGGGGRMFNARAGVNLEFNYDHFGLTGRTINDQQNLYNYYITQYCNSGADCSQVSLISGLDGNNHVWSFTLDPIYNLRTSEGVGAYVVGGGGFYHKVTNFTVPAVGTYCDYYYGCYQYQSNQVIDHYTSNAFGLNVGFGVDYKFSRFASERLYGEIRYVYLFNQAKPGVTIATATPANANVYNDFPQNSQRTSYLPIKFGIRF